MTKFFLMILVAGLTAVAQTPPAPVPVFNMSRDAVEVSSKTKTTDSSVPGKVVEEEKFNSAQNAAALRYKLELRKLDTKVAIAQAAAEAQAAAARAKAQVDAAKAASKASRSSTNPCGGWNPPLTCGGGVGGYVNSPYYYAGGARYVNVVSVGGGSNSPYYGGGGSGVRRR